jgi:epoxyqueuosine reductase
VAVALGNAPYRSDIVETLTLRLGEHPMLDEHIHWSITQQQQKRSENAIEVQLAQQKRLVRVIEKGLPRDA